MNQPFRKILKGTSTVLIITFFTLLFSYLLKYFLAKNLSLENFGLFFSVLAFLTMLYGTNTIGFGASVVRFVSEFRVKNNTRKIKSFMIYYFFIQIILYLVISLFLLIFADQISINYFKNPDAFYILLILMFGFFFATIFKTFSALFQSYQYMLVFSMLTFLPIFLSLLFSIIMFLFTDKLYVVAISYLLSYIFNALFAIGIYYFKFQKGEHINLIKEKFVPNKKDIKNLFKFTLPLIPASFANSIMLSLDILFLTYFQNLAIVGIYSIALSISNILKRIPKAIGNILFPLATELYFKNISLFKKSINKIYKYVFLATLPVTFITFSFSREIINLLFGSEFHLAANPIKILSIGFLFSSLYLINVSILIGIDKPNSYSNTIYIGLFSNIVMNLILTPTFGMQGAAFSFLISNVAMVIYSQRILMKEVEIQVPWKHWIKISLIGVLLSVLIFFLKNVFNYHSLIEAIIILPFISVVYFLLSIFFNVVTFKELLELLNIGAKVR